MTSSETPLAIGEVSILSSSVGLILNGDEPGTIPPIIPEESPFATCSPPGTVVNVGSPAENVPDVSAHEAEEWAAQIQSKLSASVAAIIEVGRLLLDAKKALGHGRYTKMVEANLPFGLRQAQKYASIARNEVLINSVHHGILPRSVNVLSQLASLGTETVLEIVTDVHTRLQNGEMVNTDSPGFWRAYRVIFLKDASNCSFCKDVDDTEPETTQAMALIASEPSSTDECGTVSTPNSSENGKGKGNPEAGEVEPEARENTCPDKSADDQDGEITGASATPTPSVHDSVPDNPGDEANTKELPPSKSEQVTEGALDNQPGPTMQAPSSNEPPIDEGTAEGQGTQLAANDNGNVIRLGTPVQKGVSSDGADNAIAQQLVAAWKASMSGYWKKAPKTVRIAFIAWLERSKELAA